MNCYQVKRKKSTWCIQQNECWGLYASCSNGVTGSEGLQISFSPEVPERLKPRFKGRNNGNRAQKLDIESRDLPSNSILLI